MSLPSPTDAPTLKTDWHCIDLTRTVGWQPRDRTDDELDTFRGLVEWVERRRIVTVGEAEEVLAQADRRTADADRALVEARRLRALIYRILHRTARGEGVEPGHLEELNRALHDAAPARRLRADESGVTWGWCLDPYRLDDLLAPVVWSAAELLTAPEAERVRVCDAEDCGWLFIDASRNRSRRWCDMSDCGNRAKVRRYRARQRVEA